MINASNLQYRGATKTGGEFDHLEIHCASDEKHFYRFLMTKDEEQHAVGHPKAHALMQFFGIDFKPGKLDNENCLVNIQTV